MNFEDKYYTITNVDNTAVAALTDNLLILIDKNIILLLIMIYYLLNIAVPCFFNLNI